MITVVVPHYNGVKGLIRLLKSIPNTIRVIVVDDNSPNKSDVEAAVEQFCNCELFFTPSNLGAGAARNIGLSKVLSGKVIFADADDYFCDNSFSILDEYLTDESDIVYFSPTSIVEGTGINGTRHSKYKTLVQTAHDGLNFDIRYKFVVPWSKLYSVDFLKLNDITFEEIVASNDLAFSVKSGHLANKIKFDLRTVYCVSESNNSLTKALSEEMFDVRFNALIRINKYLQAHHSKDKQLQMAIFVKRSLSFGFIKFINTVSTILLNGCPILKRSKKDNVNKVKC